MADGHQRSDFGKRLISTVDVHPGQDCVVQNETAAVNEGEKKHN